MTTDVHDEARAADAPFADYLAAQFIARKSFSAELSAPELEPARAACDYLLIRHDGLQFSAVCIVDCERDPARIFDLSAERTREIVGACRHYAGRIGMAKMPVHLHVIEVRAQPIDTQTRNRLKTYKRRSPLSKSIVTAWALDSSNATVWTNAPIAMRWGQGRWFERLLAGPRTQVTADDNGRRLVRVAPGRPWASFAIALMLIAMYGVQIAFAVTPQARFIGFDTQSLFALGGLNPAAVFEQGQWYRLISAVLLHGGVLHLLFNLVALLLAGFAAERLMGSAWFAATFVLGGAAGAALSLWLGPPGMVAVGASGAIMALLAAGLICSFRLVDNAQRLQIQMQLMFMLVPSLIPGANQHDIGGATDYAAHFGGAIAGALLGLGLRLNWRRYASTPAGQPVAAAIAGLGIVLAGWSLTAVAHHYPRYAHVAEYIPSDRVPARWSTLSKDQASELAQNYPDDPRGHYALGFILFGDKHYGAAEPAFRDALAAYQAHPDDFVDGFADHTRLLLALSLLLQGESVPARREAAPLCDRVDRGKIHDALMSAELCTPD